MIKLQHYSHHFSKTERNGFTLIEILIVISLIGLLTVMGMASYLNSQRQGRNSRRMTDLKTIQASLEQYYTDNNAYPNNCDPGTAYFPQGSLIDPKTGNTYLSTFTRVGGAACNNSPPTYCGCVQLDPAGSTAGNSTSSTCSGFAAGQYFCVTNLQ